ncbi:hypothetical protein EDD29_5741 [Actinocorallia herbida]|uniref:Uncharacterized protein n=1 Tax=Actinocorallia herbida TaxID=58109 RepID=A0A3N1D3H2_9ACTN|nr:hypothetical protein [Actinocorallia herbida]ROO88084.1 hypothetical protein EDD29_5741 [Actinocorallia herbida]
MNEHHADPFHDAVSEGGQRLVQILAAATIGKRTFMEWRERRRSAAAAREHLAAQAADSLIAASYADAYTAFSRALDPAWLREASLLETAQAWGTAIPHIHEKPDATQAVSLCEERLRHLHPHGMSHYDRFRTDGADHLTAMRAALPYLARDPRTHTGHPAAPKPELTSPNAADLAAESFPYTAAEAIRRGTRTTHAGSHRTPTLDRTRRRTR